MRYNGHTPGPWRVDQTMPAIVADVPPDWADPTDPEGPKETRVCSLLGAMGGHNTAADAALMGDAPELARKNEELWAIVLRVLNYMVGCEQFEEGVMIDGTGKISPAKLLRRAWEASA